MSFPDFETWCKDVVHPRDHASAPNRGPWVFDTKEWYEHYLKKHRIAKALGAKSILEVGVRYGYSAHAFLSAGATLYTGVDSDNPEHNAMGEGTCDWAVEMLGRTVPDSKVSIIKMDTQAEFPCPNPKFFEPDSCDLLHIDADHSYHGCLHDMLTFFPACRRAMLIDDYDAIGSVRDAVAEFIKKTGAMMFNTKSVNGEALLIK